MSKPPMACEPLMKTPTLNVEPTLRGPMLGGLVGQVVAVVDDVIHTRPVIAACARGVCVVRSRDPARAMARIINRRLSAL